VTNEVRRFRQLLNAWPSSDVSNLYEAWLQVTVALKDPNRGSLNEVLEPFVPSPLSRAELSLRLMMPDDSEGTDNDTQ
jgi:hypothetical protein